MEISIVPGAFGYSAVPTLEPANWKTGILSGLSSFNDSVDGGFFYLIGTVAIDSSPDIPVHRKVRLICTRTGRLVREVWSDPITGAYVFSGIRQGPWTVLSHDYSGVYNAVASDIGVATPL